jgi:hypothetical protein
MTPSVRPFNPPPRVVDPSLRPPDCYKEVTVTRGHPRSVPFLSTVEAAWAAPRKQLAADLAAVGETLENAHWQWLWKAQRPDHWHTLVTVQRDDEIQGIMAVENLLRPARSPASVSGWVLYADFLEVAPWNYRVPQDRSRPAVRLPRYAAVGTVLIAEAVRMSLGAVAGGCVGLHALPQAAEFYAQRCGMTDFGPDPNYHDLAYFEYPPGTTAAVLTRLGLSA